VIGGQPGARRAGQGARGGLASPTVPVVAQPPLATAADDARAERGSARSVTRNVVRAVLWSALAIAFALTCLSIGLPTDRVLLLGWVLAALGVHAVTEGWRRVVRLVVDWVPLAALLVLYDLSRGMADQLGVAVHVAAPAAADRFLGGGTLPTAWLQHHWDARWWEAVATLVYSSHFVVTPLVLGVLWLRNRAHWAAYARMVLVLSAAGLVTYVVYPAAPPWLAAKEHVVAPLHRLSSAGWQVLGLPRAGALLEHGQGQVNAVAAVPSLHTAFAVLLCLVLFPRVRRLWQRAALVGYALLMPLVLVWAGEHYVIDTLLGAAYAGAVALLVPRLTQVVVRAAARIPRWRPLGVPTVDA
jgi:hypothetical protein